MTCSNILETSEMYRYHGTSDAYLRCQIATGGISSSTDSIQDVTLATDDSDDRFIIFDGKSVVHRKAWDDWYSLEFVNNISRENLNSFM